MSTRLDSQGICWRLGINGPIRGDALADMVWLDAEGYRVTIRGQKRRRDGNPYVAITIRPGVSSDG